MCGFLWRKYLHESTMRMRKGIVIMITEQKDTDLEVEYEKNTDQRSE